MLTFFTRRIILRSIPPPNDDAELLSLERNEGDEIVESSPTNLYPTSDPIIKGSSYMQRLLSYVDVVFNVLVCRPLSSSIDKDAEPLM